MIWHVIAIRTFNTEAILQHLRDNWKPFAATDEYLWLRKFAPEIKEPQPKPAKPASKT